MRHGGPKIVIPQGASNLGVYIKMSPALFTRLFCLLTLTIATCSALATKPSPDCKTSLDAAAMELIYAPKEKALMLQALNQGVDQLITYGQIEEIAPVITMILRLAPESKPALEKKIERYLQNTTVFNVTPDDVERMSAAIPMPLNFKIGTIDTFVTKYRLAEVHRAFQEFKLTEESKPFAPTISRVRFTAAMAKATFALGRRDLTDKAATLLLRYNQFESVARIALLFDDDALLFKAGTLALTRFLFDSKFDVNPLNMGRETDLLNLAMSTLATVRGPLASRARQMLRDLGMALTGMNDPEWLAYDAVNYVSISALRLSGEFQHFQGSDGGGAIRPQNFVTKIEDKKLKAVMRKRLNRLIDTDPIRANGTGEIALYTQATGDLSIATRILRSASAFASEVDRYHSQNLRVQIEMMGLLGQETAAYNLIMDAYEKGALRSIGFLYAALREVHKLSDIPFKDIFERFVQSQKVRDELSESRAILLTKLTLDRNLNVGFPSIRGEAARALRLLDS